jgi:signal recognition particle receptor subunit beta
MADNHPTTVADIPHSTASSALGGTSSALWLSVLAAAVVGLAVALYFFWPFRSGSAASSGAPSQTRSAVARAAKGAVLLCGPPGSGKTALYHWLAFGRRVDTVPSMEYSAVFTPLAGSAAGSPRVKLMDYPGAQQLRASLLRSARQCSGVLLLVDAAGGAAHAREAASVLLDLLTDPEVARAAPHFMVAASKSDLPGALAPAQLRERLEAELERLKRGTRGLDVAGGAEDQPLLLGRVGEQFSFDHAPLRVRWGVVGGLAGGGEVNADEAHKFVAEAAAS